MYTLIPLVLVPIKKVILKKNHSSVDFVKKNLNFAGYDSNPVEDGSLDDYFTVIPIEMNKMVKAACEDLDLNGKLVLRTKNFFALGVLFYIHFKGYGNVSTVLIIKEFSRATYSKKYPSKSLTSHKIVCCNKFLNFEF